MYDLETKEFSTSRDVIFYENTFPFASQKQIPAEKFLSPDHEKPFHEEGDECFNTPTQFSVPHMEETQHESSVIIHDAEEIHDELTQGEHNPVEPRVEQNKEEQDSVVAPDQNSTREQRTRRPPEYLKDYVCHTATNGPLGMSHEPSNSSGKSYHISKYINYDKFSCKHRAFLAAIMSNSEPKNYMQDAQCP